MNSRNTSLDKEKQDTLLCIDLNDRAFRNKNRKTLALGLHIHGPEPSQLAPSKCLMKPILAKDGISNDRLTDDGPRIDSTRSSTTAKLATKHCAPTSLNEKMLTLALILHIVAPVIIHG